MKFPFGNCNILNLYGEPIYVKADATTEELADIRELVKTKLMELEENAPRIYNEAKKQKKWNKKL